MYVVTVDFKIKPLHVADFKREMLVNARSSVEKEAGCRYFDVTVSENDPAHFFLYEIYDDEAAFLTHMTTSHFKVVDVAIEPWVQEKVVKTFILVDKA